MSTNLSMLGVSTPDGVGSGSAKNNSVNLNHINGGHLVSSSANLIQDSTTASDGTASSVRSSSSSGQNRELNAQNTNPHLTYATNYLQQGIWIQPQQSPQQTDHQQPPPTGHYQLPMLVGESYFTAQQQNGHPCYATICNKPVQQHFGANNNNYGTLPLQPHSAQCHQMVPTSDGGEAYFESNYGTLISRSSAYKTLGYATTLASSMQQTKPIL